MSDAGVPSRPEGAAPTSPGIGDSGNPMRADVRIEIRYLSAVRERTGRAREEASFAAGTTLQEVAAWLDDCYGLLLPSSQYMATLNGSGWGQLPAGLSTEIRERDVICLFPPVAGG